MAATTVQPGTSHDFSAADLAARRSWRSTKSHVFTALMALSFVAVMVPPGGVASTHPTADRRGSPERALGRRAASGRRRLVAVPQGGADIAVLAQLPRHERPGHRGGDPQ